MEPVDYHKSVETHKKQTAKSASEQSGAPLFKDQARQWLADGASRKRNPFRSETIKTYQSRLNSLIPLIGEKPVDVIGNTILRNVATELAEQQFSASTIELSLNIIKQIRASVTDEEGAQIYPYTWNTDFIDAPIVDKTMQKRPIASTQAIQDAISRAVPHLQAFIAILAGTGLRVQECLALRLDPDDHKSTVWIPSESKIIIRQQRDGNKFGPPKTAAGIREIDLSVELNDYLLKTLGNEYLLTLNGNCDNLVFPGSESNYAKLIARLGIVGGFHALRRHRTTYIRMQDVPESLVKFWTGHADPTVTGRYTQVGSEIAARKVYANKVGLGFEL